MSRDEYDITGVTIYISHSKWIVQKFKQEGWRRGYAGAEPGSWRDTEIDMRPWTVAKLLGFSKRYGCRDFDEICSR
jgi:hypothetical protein